MNKIELRLASLDMSTRLATTNPDIISGIAAGDTSQIGKIVTDSAAQFYAYLMQDVPVEQPQAA